MPDQPCPDHAPGISFLCPNRAPILLPSKNRDFSHFIELNYCYLFTSFLSIKKQHRPPGTGYPFKALNT